MIKGDEYEARNDFPVPLPQSVGVIKGDEYWVKEGIFSHFIIMIQILIPVGVIDRLFSKAQKKSTM